MTILHQSGPLSLEATPLTGRAEPGVLVFDRNRVMVALTPVNLLILSYTTQRGSGQFEVGRVVNFAPEWLMWSGDSNTVSSEEWVEQC